MEKPILVFGGSGHYGRHIVRNLQQQNIPLRIFTRNIERARQYLGEAEYFAGDLTSKAALKEALAGCEGVIVSISAFSPALIRKLRAIEVDAVQEIVTAAEQCGVRRLVYLSAYELRQELIRELNYEIGQVKLDVESIIRQSNLDWTLLGCAFSMQLIFSFLRGDKMAVPGGGPPALPVVAANDVGAVAAQSILRSDLIGQRIRIPGPEALSFAQAAERIGAVSGQPVRLLKIPLLPFRLAALVTRPFTPYMKHLFASIRLMNRFPQDLAVQVPQDHARLREMFDYTPVTLEDEARRRLVNAPLD